MKVKVVVKPNAKKNEITRQDDGTLLVRVSTPPVEGKANEKVIELLSDFYKKPKRNIEIVSGFKGRIKIVEIQ
jgi:uncharacterized protein